MNEQYSQQQLQQQFSDEDLREMEEEQEDKAEDMSEDQFQLSKEVQEAYGSPEPDEKQNQHTFLHKATFDSPDTVKTTFLSESELGRPLFNVRFLLDMHDISKYYLDPILKDLRLEPQHNGIANYFWEKIQNITGSGMSNKGFSMNLNVTRKMDTVRKRIRDTSKLKGGTQNK